MAPHSPRQVRVELHVILEYWAVKDRDIFKRQAPVKDKLDGSENDDYPMNKGFGSVATIAAELPPKEFCH